MGDKPAQIGGAKQAESRQVVENRGRGGVWITASARYGRAGVGGGKQNSTLLQRHSSTPLCDFNRLASSGGERQVLAS